VLVAGVRISSDLTHFRAWKDAIYALFPLPNNVLAIYNSKMIDNTMITIGNSSANHVFIKILATSNNPISIPTVVRINADILNKNPQNTRISGSK
jgi:hypothetical protein